MMAVVQRTCTEIRQRERWKGSEGDSCSFDEFRETEAYVLLGAPGSGKTTEFTRQAELADGCYVTARDFMTFDDRPEWHDTSLFIDGLDEVRAGSGDGRTPLDAIRAKLDRLGCPRFRMSCRDADWLGPNDSEHLQSVSPDGNVTVLRLGPLSGENIREILRGYSDIEVDADEFIESARNRGVDGLLANPQTLWMVAEAVAGGEWPETRTQAFELSCQRALLTEHNLEHRITDADGADIATLMRVAGRLCAVQLLTGAKGWTTLGGETGPGFPSLDSVPGQDRYVHRQVVRSKLFAASGAVSANPRVESYIAPVHPQIAEFLAARYLAGLIIRDGLAPGRILALMTGHDGFVVPQLRGLSAWLAAHSKRSRMEIIARDPLGTVLYGDVREFSSNEKQAVLKALEREANRNPWFAMLIESNSRLGDLASPDMESVFRDILGDPARDAARQSFVDIAFGTLVHGQPLPGLAELLLAVIRDSAWWPRIKHSAIKAFARHRRDAEKMPTELLAVMDDVYEERLPDPDDDLLGCLLTALYPQGISAPEVLMYLRVSKRPSHCPRYEYFWTGILPRRSTCGQVARLLDELAVRYEALREELQQHRRPIFFLRRLPMVLLDRFIELSPDGIEPSRLFDWLGVAGWVGDWQLDRRFALKESERIKSWLTDRPELWKSLFELGLQRCIDSPQCADMNGFKRCMHMEQERRLLGVDRPPDYGVWCLEQAIAAKHRVPATWFMGRVADAVHRHRWDESLSRKRVEARIAGKAVLENAFAERMSELEKSDAWQESSDADVESEEQYQSKWRDAVTREQTALRENRGKPALLHRLAETYFVEFADVVGNTPQDRLNSLLGNERSLVEAVLTGFRGTIRRDDLPSDEEIIRLGTRNRVHLLALPFMAGLEEIFRDAPSGDLPLDDARMRLAIAIHYNSRIPLHLRNRTGEPQDWFPLVLQRQPEMVADILIRTARARLRSGADISHDLHGLAHSPDHAALARLVSLRLLSAIPVRCTERQLQSLHHLLQAACLHCESEPFRRLAEKKLSSRSMNMGQRVYWLAAGLLTWQGPYVDELESYVAGKERRVRRLAEFIARTYERPREAIRHLDVPAVAALIRVIGASCRQQALDREARVGGSETWVTNAAHRISALIDALASIPSDTASRTLADLTADESLDSWRSRLTDAAYRQNAIRREANFRHRDSERVIAVLKNGKPANAADLAALTLSHLREIGQTIRTGNTSDWRQYWNMESPTKPTVPKHEDICRDALLSDLRYRLELVGIDAQPEGRYADDKRSDIRVSFGGYNIPVEIKKSCHRELWSAIRTQLIAKYARDPGAYDHGIYLVFWFGDTVSCRPTPGEGVPPRNADELEQGLRGTLSAEEQLKISICVIDVSMPTHASSLRNPIAQI